MHIETISVGPYEVNCYVLHNHGAEAVVIDPGSEPEKILKYSRINRLTPVAYLLTHGHQDHLSALTAMLEAYPAPVLMHAEEQRWAFTNRNLIPPFYMTPTATPATLRAVTDGNELPIAGMNFRVIFTPGHTPGGVCYFAPDDQALFCGDTLFRGSAGRTDLPGGNGRVLAQSLKRLKQLPPDTRVFPGHGETTTIGAEQRGNIFFRSPAT
ncbi:MAG: MBL fold metallo-hydrolase [Verrucomicrobia bacterium]|nr:MAG: MBL fold metallo-hydrolase [Verrucomicrobiota bacterium]